MSLTLRDLHSLDQFRRVVELEKLVWGYADAEDVVPVPILAVTVRRGGILIGAYAAPGEMVGFVYSLPAFRGTERTQWSHMLGVLDRYRNSGLGLRLKLAQRQRALGMGVALVEWTFDPLQALNAHFNFRKLGVVAEEYEENIYGESSSPLHRGTPTDRLVAAWHLGDARAIGRIEGHAEAAAWLDLPEVLQIPGVNDMVSEGEWPACGELELGLQAVRVRLTIPAEFGRLGREQPALARAWRDATRRSFTTYLGRGYRVVDFVLDRDARRGHYVLSRGSGSL
jgi:predicted GNAT superfamily acetyltransferase